MLTIAEVKRVTALLSQIGGIQISTRYAEGQLTVQSSVPRLADAQTITQGFQQISGVKTVLNTAQLNPLRIESRFYFPLGSATIIPRDLTDKIQQVKIFLNQHPVLSLKITGYSSSFGNPSITDSALSIERAKAVQKALIQQGVRLDLLQVNGSTNLPPGVKLSQPDWMKRCVILEVVTPKARSNGSNKRK